MGLSRYGQRFRQHPLLLSLPVVVSVVFAAWFGLGAPRAYRSTSALWIDNGPVVGSSLYNLSAIEAAAAAGQLDRSQVGPAPAEQLVLNELLAEPSFDLAVGRDSLLPRFLGSGARTGFSPSVLLKRSSGSPAFEAALSVASEVKSLAQGPQVLELSYTGPNPVVARSVLASLIRHLQSAAPSDSDELVNEEVGFFQRASVQAARAVANDKSAAAAYKRENPLATAQPDTIYGSLSTSLKLATTALSASLSAVGSIRQGPDAGEKAIIRVIDPPSLPSPIVNPTQNVLGLLGGAFAGLVISFLAAFVATPTRQSKWDSELSSARWTRIAYDPRLAAHRRRARRISSSRPTRGAA